MSLFDVVVNDDEVTPVIKLLMTLSGIVEQSWVNMSELQGGRSATAAGGSSTGSKPTVL